MVVKLIGQVDGSDIIFEYVGGDSWRAVIPPTLSGMYVVELTTVDDAGNIGRYVKYMITIDMTCLKVEIQPLRYERHIVECSYGSILLNQGRQYFSEVMNMDATLRIGETRHIKIKVYSVKSEKFIITSAKYELIYKKTGSVEKQGSATIEDQMIDTIITPLLTGKYHLKFKYTIADEELIDVVEVEVLD